MADEQRAVALLFAQHVPEIASGIVEIRALARIPGHRCKIAVQGNVPKVDSVGVCVGVRGFRIKNLVDALDGERIDLIRWDEDAEKMIANALQPAAIEKVILHLAENRAVVIVRADQVSIALGRNGQNRLLASVLSGWEIEVEEL